MLDRNNCNRDCLDDVENSFQTHTDEEDYDMGTGANCTPLTIPEFINARSLHSRENLPIPPPTESPNTGQSVQEAIAQNSPADPINRLAEVLVGMHNRPSAQILMVRPVSTTTLTFDGKSEKFELCEDLFHTMIKMQPDMTKQ